MKVHRNPPLKNVEKIGNFLNPRTRELTIIFRGYKPGNNRKQLFWNNCGRRILLTQKEFKTWEPM